MCLTFSSVPPHFSFGFQMRCHVNLLGLQLVFSDSCPNAQRISFCCFYCSPYSYNLIHFHPSSHHVYLQSRWQTALPDLCFQLSPGHLHLKSAHYLRSTDPELTSAASSWTCAYLLLHFISVKITTFGQMGQGRNSGTVFDPSLSFNFHKPALKFTS